MKGLDVQARSSKDCKAKPTEGKVNGSEKQKGPREVKTEEIELKLEAKEEQEDEDVKGAADVKEEVKKEEAKEEAEVKQEVNMEQSLALDIRVSFGELCGVRRASQLQHGHNITRSRAHSEKYRTQHLFRSWFPALAVFTTGHKNQLECDCESPCSLSCSAFLFGQGTRRRTLESLEKRRGMARSSLAESRRLTSLHSSICQAFCASCDPKLEAFCHRKPRRRPPEASQSYGALAV